MERVLVAGATGYLGRFIIKELKKQGYYTIALARNANKLIELDDYIDRYVEAEITDPDTVENICSEVDYVISSIGITRQKDGLNYMDVDYQANLNLLDEALKQNVKKFIYISVLNAHLMKNLKMVAAKELFVDKLNTSGIDYTIIRPNGFFSDMTELLNLAKKGTIYLFGNGKYKSNPIHGYDLAEVCVKCLSDERKEIEVGGPEILTQNDIARTAFDALKKKVRIKHIPVWIESVLIRIIRLLTNQRVYGPIEFFLTVMTMDMVAPKYGRHKLADYYKEISK